MIPNDTKIQSADLRIKDLDASLKFYSYLLGFKEIERKENTSFLSSDGVYPYLISLSEDKHALVAPRNSTGLFHIAFLFPNRKEMARVFLRLHNHGQKFQGFSDHIVSEAIYLADPDGNGIEIYVDKPREEWQWHDGEVEMNTLPLDLSLITSELDDIDVWNGIHPQTNIGHIHLKASDLNKAKMFYHKILGLDITVESYPGALFLSAGGYHHHIGTNTWYSKNSSPAPENSLGLISYTIKIPEQNYLDKIKETASNNNLLITSGNSETIIKDFDNNRITLTS